MRVPAIVVVIGAVAGLAVGVEAGYVAGMWHANAAAVAADAAHANFVGVLHRRNAALAAVVDVQAYRRSTEDRLGLRVVGSAARFADGCGSASLSGGPISRDRMFEVLPTLLTELNRYPPDVVRAVGLHQVVVCTAFQDQGKPEGGVADFAAGTIYLSADGFDAESAWWRHTIHHEMFNLLDHSAGTLDAADPDWTAANPAGFHYGPGGFAATAENASTDLSSAVTGFVTTYARSAIEEDKAEVYGWLMADPAAVAARVRVDPTLATKVRRMQAVVLGVNEKLAAELPAAD